MRRWRRRRRRRRKRRKRLLLLARYGFGLVRSARVGDDPCSLSFNATLTLRLSTMTLELHLRHLYTKTPRSTASGVDDDVEITT
jgi:hypothetical protein